MTPSEIAAGLTRNQTLIVTGRDWDIASRRARTRARNDVRHLRLMYSEGDNLTPAGIEARNILLSQEGI